MSFRVGFFDVFVHDEYVQVVIDITGIDIKKLYIGVSKKKNSFIMKIPNNKNIFERALPVIVKDDLKWTVNNGILEVNIMR